MAKKYTIEIDADVIGQKDVDKLADSLEDVSKSADNATASIEEENEALEKNIETTEEATRETKSLNKQQTALAATMINLGILVAEHQAKVKVASKAWRVFLRLLPGIGTAIAVVTGVIILYNKALNSANDYLLSNVEAQQKMFTQTSAATAWANIWKDVSIWFGEFFHSFRDFWSFFKNITGEEILKGIGLGEYVYDAQEAIEAQNRLNTEWEKSLTTIQQLTFDSEDYLKTVNNENLSNKERIQGAVDWSAAQLKILEINKQRLEDQILLNKSLRERGPEEENQLEQLNRQLEENARLRQNVSTTSAEMVKNVLAVKDAVEEEYEAVAEINRLFKENLSTEDDGDILQQAGLTPSQAELLLRQEAFQRHKDWLNSSLQEAGGMWGDYFSLLKDLYGKDVEWSKLTSEEKLATVSMTAQATLGIAGNLINQMADAASDDFETQKKYRIAGATVSTLQGMIGAFMGGVSTAPGPFGLVLGAVLAAATGAMGFMNIKKIKNSTPESPATAGDLSSGGSGAIPSAPSLSLVSPLTTGEEALATGISTSLEPQKNYVVGSDMTSQQELDRHIENNATL